MAINKLAHKHFILIVCMFFVFVVFFVRGILTLDPDFGWHLRMGEMISSLGIPKTDPFSYTMSSYPFIDHEWLTNFLIYKLYFSIGYFWISVIYSFLALIILVLVSLKENRNFHFWIIPFLLSFGIVFSFFGVRPQVESWVFWALLLHVILSEKRWKHYKFFLPLLLLVWVNLHGSFAVGIVGLVMVLLLRFIRIKRVIFSDLVIIFLCLFATFVNPYGIRVWKEVWDQISDSSLRWTIVEWMPAVTRFDPALLFYISLSLVLIFRYRKKILLEELALYLFFLIQGILSQRHIPLWVIVSLPIVIRSLSYLSKDIPKGMESRERVSRAWKVSLIAIVLLVLFEVLFSLKDSMSLSEDAFYPKNAIAYLKARPSASSGQVFNEYGWGGYLIWKFPQKKVFIDGRMPSWRWNANNISESNYAMKDYLGIVDGTTDLEPFFKKYNIDTVLWPRLNQNKPTTITEALDRLVCKYIRFRICRYLDNNFIERLKEKGWREVYRDNVAVVYNKP